MPNTMSAKKALRQNEKRRQHNLFWKRRVDAGIKMLKKALQQSDSSSEKLSELQSTFQKALDKAAKNNVIHKNKANRLKSRYAKKLTAVTAQNTTETKKRSPKAKTK